MVEGSGSFYCCCRWPWRCRGVGTSDWIRFWRKIQNLRAVFSDCFFGGNDDVWKYGNFGWIIKTAQIRRIQNSQELLTENVYHMKRIDPFEKLNSANFGSFNGPPEISRFPDLIISARNVIGRTDPEESNKRSNVRKLPVGVKLLSKNNNPSLYCRTEGAGDKNMASPCQRRSFLHPSSLKCNAIELLLFLHASSSYKWTYGETELIFRKVQPNFFGGGDGESIHFFQNRWNYQWYFGEKRTKSGTVWDTKQNLQKRPKQFSKRWEGEDDPSLSWGWTYRPNILRLTTAIEDR